LIVPGQIILHYRTIEKLGEGRSGALSPLYAWRARAVRRKIRWSSVAGVFAMAGAALAWWFIRPLPPPRIVGSTQLTNDGLTKWMPLLSGASLVFFSSGMNGDEAEQVSLKGGETMTVPLPRGDTKLIDVSPHGSELLVGKSIGSDSSNGETELWVDPLFAGAPRRLGNLIADGPVAVWSPDGRQLIYAYKKELHIARSDGTDLGKLATAPGRLGFLRWSPDGSNVRFSVAEEKDNKLSLWEMSVANGALRPVLPGWKPSSSVCCGNWSPDGRYFAFRVSGAGTSNIWVLREHPGLHWGGKEPVQLTSGPMAAFAPVFSADGKRLLIEGFQDREEFHRYDLETGQIVPELIGTSGRGLEYSKDGKWVAYVSVPDGSLWRSADDGSQRLKLTSPPLHASMPHWSPDGKQIAFFGRSPTTPTGIYVVPFESGAVQQVTRADAGTMGDAFFCWSPDGASILFAARGSPEVGEKRLRDLDVKASAVSTLPSPEGMLSADRSADGRFSGGMSRSEWKIALYEIASRKQTEVSNNRHGWLNWSRDGKSLFVRADHAWWRFKMGARELENVTSLQKIAVGRQGWFTPGLNNALVTSRNVGTDEIYALSWEAP
jgi:eukaryotic-like serine/threonine-protein kinase